MMVCKYKGDVADEYCKSCNGITMMVDGKEISCETCAGYEAGTEEIKEEKTVEEVKTEELPINPHTTNENTPKTDEKKAVNKTTSKKEKPVKDDSSALNKVSDISTVKALRYMSGASCEVNGTWYKFEACEERILPEGLSDEEVETEREKLWAKLNSEIDKQILDVSKQ